MQLCAWVSERMSVDLMLSPNLLCGSGNVSAYVLSLMQQVVAIECKLGVSIEQLLRGEVENTSLVSSGEPLFRVTGDKLIVGERHTLLILCLRYTVFGDRPRVGE